MVGLAGFEPTTSASRTQRTTKLCYSPIPVGPGEKRRLTQNQGVDNSILGVFVDRHPQTKAHFEIEVGLKKTRLGHVELGAPEPGYPPLRGRDY